MPPVGLGGVKNHPTSNTHYVGVAIAAPAVGRGGERYHTSGVGRNLGFDLASEHTTTPLIIIGVVV